MTEPGHAEPRIWYTKLVNEEAMAQDQITGKGADTGLMLQGCRMSIQHGAVVIYTDHYPETLPELEGTILKHLPGGEPLVEFRPRQPPEIVDSFTPVRDETGKPNITGLLPPGPEDATGSRLAGRAPESGPPVEPLAGDQPLGDPAVSLDQRALPVKPKS